MVCAGSLRDPGSVQALLAHQPDLAARNQQGRTALHMAAYWGHAMGADGAPGGCLAALIDAGAPLDGVETVYGHTVDDLAGQALVESEILAMHEVVGGLMRIGRVKLRGALWTVAIPIAER